MRLIDSLAVAGSLIQAARATQPAAGKPIRLAGYLAGRPRKIRFARSRLARFTRLQPPRIWTRGSAHADSARLAGPASEGSADVLTYLVTVGVEATPGERAG